MNEKFKEVQHSLVGNFAQFLFPDPEPINLDLESYQFKVISFQRLLSSAKIAMSNIIH